MKSGLRLPLWVELKMIRADGFSADVLWCFRSLNAAHNVRECICPAAEAALELAHRHRGQEALQAGLGAKSLRRVALQGFGRDLSEILSSELPSILQAERHSSMYSAVALPSHEMWSSSDKKSISPGFFIHRSHVGHDQSSRCTRESDERQDSYILLQS